MLVFGTLIFNEILVLPFWGFNKYTKDALSTIPKDSVRIQTQMNNSMLTTN